MAKIGPRAVARVTFRIRSTPPLSTTLSLLVARLHMLDRPAGRASASSRVLPPCLPQVSVIWERAGMRITAPHGTLPAARILSHARSTSLPPTTQSCSVARQPMAASQRTAASRGSPTPPQKDPRMRPHTFHRQCPQVNPLNNQAAILPQVLPLCCQLLHQL